MPRTNLTLATSATLATLATLAAFAVGAAILLCPSALSAKTTVTVGDAVLQVGPENSARVTSLKFKGTELLYTVASGGNILWGSTFWASPQTDWTASCKSAKNLDCFPPPAALDGNSYTESINALDSTGSYTGVAESYTHLRFRKTFGYSLQDSSFRNLYHMVNTSSSPISWAPWEDTRFPSGGLTFWPTGEGAVTGNATMLTQTKDTLGVTWFKYDSSATLSGRTKIYGDGGAAGWMAHLDKNRVLFIKKFPDTPASKKAPGVENECEIYVTAALLEMELQGPYGPIPGNDSLAWQVKWYVRKLPDNIAVSRNKELVEFVTKIISDTVPTTGVSTRSGSRLNGFHLTRIQGGIRLDSPREVAMQVSLCDAGGKELYRLRQGVFTAGSQVLSLPGNGYMQGPIWLVGRESASGAVLFRQMMAALLPQ